MSNQLLLAERVVAAIRAVVGPGPVVLHEPIFSGNEWHYLKECVDSTVVSSTGRFVDRFEADLAAYTGATHAVAVVNGTAALHIALKLAGVQAGDEVLIPALTFVATANAVTYCNATPHFVDSEVRTLGVDAAKLRDYLASHTEQRAGLCVNRASGRVIRALVPMHAYGHPVDLDGLLAVAHDFNLALVEDAAESLGSTYHGQHTGTFGLLGTLSFNGNKTITTGGGGAIITNVAALARHAKYLTEALVRSGHQLRAFVLSSSLNSWGGLINVHPMLRAGSKFFLAIFATRTEPKKLRDVRRSSTWPHSSVFPTPTTLPTHL